MPLLILADDLTGAADCAVVFAVRGLSTHVVLDYKRLMPSREIGGVLAVDIDSRGLTQASAVKATVACWEALADSSTRLYKKIDSTLRGHWAQEVGALRRSAGVAVVAPAFPETGRTTRAGRQYVDGEPLEASPFATRDKGGPADIGLALRAQGLRTAYFALKFIRSAPESIKARLIEEMRRGVDAVVCDAECRGDLAAIAQATISLTEPIFWVGSAGLARELAGLIAQASRTGVNAINMNLGGCARVLALVGTPTLASQQQAKLLAAESGISDLAVPAAVLDGGAGHDDWSAWRARIGARLASGDLLLRVGGAHSSPELIRRAGLSRSLALLAFTQTAVPDGLVATGGDTARAMLDTLGVSTLRLHAEIEPGVVLSEALGALPLSVVTKSGAFGGASALRDAYRLLKSGCSAPAFNESTRLPS